jgi:hypothetical protein
MELNYLTLLRELEREVAAGANLKLPADRDGLQRARKWFKGRFSGGLLGFAASQLAKGEQRIAKKLYIKAEEMRHQETLTLRSLRKLSEAQDVYAFDHPPSWPPVVPTDQLVSRFVGHAIGLHSENPEADFAAQVEASFRETAVPALAWGLLTQLATLPAEDKDAATGALLRRLDQETGAKPDSAELIIDAAGRRIALPYLRLTEGFLRLLTQKGAEWRISVEAAAKLRGQLRVEFAKLAADTNGAFPAVLALHYGPQRGGSDRAHAVALAQRRSQTSAAFLRERIELLATARAPELDPFRRLCATDLRAACQEAQAWLSADASGETADRGRLAAGRAYWLARQTFGKHDLAAAEWLTAIVERTNDEGRVIHQTAANLAPQELAGVEWASKLTLQLLREAARAYRGRDDLRAICLRFAAGYATNPRYHRASAVLALQQVVVEEYAREPAARARLTDMFRARLAWQSQATLLPTKNRGEIRKAAGFYQSAVSGLGTPKDGLDAEAPVHLFPELLAFLETYHNESKGGEKLLRVIDYVVQQNYGVYFDAVTERQLIAAGLEQFKAWHAQIEDAMVRKNSEVGVRLRAEKEAGRPTSGIILQYCMETLGRIEYGYTPAKGERAKSA